MPNRSLVLIEAPTNLGLKQLKSDRPPGVDRMPDVLLESGLSGSLGWTDRIRVTSPPYTGIVDEATGILHAQSLREYSAELAAVVGSILDKGQTPIVLGGDCSIVIGIALALHQRGRFGLSFIDGHKDLLTPTLSRTGGAAGMDLALAIGEGPPELMSPADDPSLLRRKDVALLGYRDGGDLYPREYLARCVGPMFTASLRDLRRRGFRQVALETLAHFAGEHRNGFWIHLDVDVLDSGLMPAVDSPQADGMSWRELAELLEPLLVSPWAVGLDVTIYDPDRDPSREAAKALAQFIASILSATLQADSSPETTQARSLQDVSPRHETGHGVDEGKESTDRRVR